MNKMTYIGLLCLILISCTVMLIMAVSPKIITVNADTDYSTAKAMCVIDASSKRVLRQKDCDKRLPMASTTKIMTALIALEKCEDLDEVFDVDNRASGIEGTSMYLQKDERLSMRELLYGLMLNSGNDSATAIAYKIGGGNLQNFVDMMNNKCDELNLKNTHFDNPHGLDSDTHYTSAYDLAVITSKAMENADFREIVSTKIKQISGNSQVNARFMRNKHKLLGVMDGCEGVKTGFTDNARRCCVTSVKRDDLRLICVVLNCQDMFEDSRSQLEKAFEEYENTCVLEPYYMIGDIKVENGEQEVVKTYVENACYYPLKQDEKQLIRYEVENLSECLVAPVLKNQVVGKLKIYFENQVIATCDILTMEQVNEKTIMDKVNDIIEKWYLGSDN